MPRRYKFFTKEISGIFTIPSGVIATQTEILEKIMKEIPEIGILTTKSIGLEPQKGNPEPIIAQYNKFPLSFVNAVGLANPGVDDFKKSLSKIRIPNDKFLLISIFGSNENEFKKVAEKLFELADGFELNISCPHSDKYGQAVGQDLKLVEKIIKTVSSLRKPTFIKISPNLNMKETLKHAIKGGISGITAINTKGPELYLHDNHPVLSNKVGGISGKAILELGLKCVREIRRMTTSPIIGCGGISVAEDVKKYKLAGANYFGIGSALAGMNTEEIKEYFQELMKDFEFNTNGVERFLKNKLSMEYKKYKIKENKKLAEDLFLLRFNDKIKTNPGQFVFAWIPEIGEKPFSVFDDEPLTLLIKKRGCLTEKLWELAKGDYLYIRGPYGNSPEIKGKTLLVGGGTGIAGLYLFAKRNKNTIAILGARDKKCLFSKTFKKVCKEVYLMTENGEIGDKGMSTDNLEEIIVNARPEYCLNCGPKPMVKTAIQKESKYLTPDHIYSSIEYLTKCGIGLCGSCTNSDGYRSCVDGTFFKD